VSLVTGYILFAHGSRVEAANDAVRALARDFALLRGGALVEAAFLELAEPALESAVGLLAGRGATEICVLPYFLTLGLHLQRDLPELVAQAAEKHHPLPLRVAAPLDGHPALAQILMARADEARHLAHHPVKAKASL
jgi:sirohydrochlorin ferrochelatase